MVAWRKKAVAAACALCLTLVPLTAQADSLQQQLSQYQQQYNQLNQQVSGQKQQLDSATQKVLALQQSIKALNSSIESYKSQISDQQNQLQVLNQQKQKLEAQRQQHIEQLQSFLQANYENGSSSYWMSLLSSNSWSELFDRVYEVRSIVGYFHNLQQQIADSDKQIADQQSIIQQKTSQLQTTLASKQQVQQSTEQMAATQQSVLNGLNQQQKATIAAASQAQSNVNRVQELIREAQIEAQLRAQQGAPSETGGVTGTVTANGSASALVSYALSFVGTPYVWGGTSPSGWDCSGFVQYIYRHFGVNLDRVSEDQFTEGVFVSPSDLRPGDLVFFDTDHLPPWEATHVGIYIGGGQMVNAEMPSVGTVTDSVFDPSYWGRHYLGARRILAN